MAQPEMLYENDVIFCTGAFLRPVELEINGIKSWRWVMVGSEDSSFLDGEEVLVYDYANTLQGLLCEVEDNDF